MDTDRAFVEIKCCLMPVDLPPLRVQDFMGKGLIGFHSDMPFGQALESRAPLEDRSLDLVLCPPLCVFAPLSRPEV